MTKLVLIGNVNPQGLDEPSITRIQFPEDRSGSEALAEIKDLWTKAHSDDPPEWVESSDPKLAQALAYSFECEVGRPENWTSLGDEWNVDETVEETK